MHLRNAASLWRNQRLWLLRSRPCKRPWRPVHPLEPRRRRLRRQQSANGSSNTALLSHLGVNPVEYGYGPTTWYNCNNATGGTSVPDNQAPPGAYLITQ